MLGKGKKKEGVAPAPKAPKPEKAPKAKGGGFSLLKKKEAGAPAKAPAQEKPASAPGEKKPFFSFLKPKPKSAKAPPPKAPAPASAPAADAEKPKGPFGLSLPFGKKGPKAAPAPGQEGGKKPANLGQLAVVGVLLLILVGLPTGKRLLRNFLQDKTQQGVDAAKEALGNAGVPGMPGASGSVALTPSASASASAPMPPPPAPKPAPAAKAASPSAPAPVASQPPPPPGNGAPPPPPSAAASIANAPPPPPPTATKEKPKTDFQLFIEAIKKAKEDVVTTLINAGRNLNDKDAAGRTPLFVSLLFAEDNLDQEEIATLLIDNGADVNVKVLPMGSTLSLAVENGNLELVEKLVQKGVKLEEEDGDGFTPLMRAISLNRDKIAFFLRKKGAKDRPRPKAAAATTAASPSAPAPPALPPLQ